MIRKYLYLLLLTIGILSLTPVPDAYAAAGSKNEGKLSISVYTGRTADLGEYIEYSPSLEKYRDWDAGYKSGNTKIATVSKTGLVKGISEGKTTITVSFKSYEWSAKKKAYVDTTVKKQSMSVLFCMTVPPAGIIFIMISRTARLQSPD